MAVKVFSASPLGMDGKIIEIEVDSSSGQAVFNIVGLPDAAVKESQDRVSSAIRNSALRAPYFYGRITVNLAPADLRKEGPGFDLPIALGVLLETGQVNNIPEDACFLGELALDGRLRPVKGALPIAISLKEKGFNRFFLPKENAEEANLTEDLEIYPIETLAQLIDHFSQTKKVFPLKKNQNYFKDLAEIEPIHDFCFIKGQEHAKRALEIAVSGGHNILLSGPPGSGKTMLAQSIPSIMPPLSIEEAFEVTKIYSISGKTNSDNPFIKERPFRAPHHSASAASLVGGGTFPRPGEISLANRGVLFLDEFPEFPKEVIENLRQPLENGEISIARAQGALTFPTNFILVAAMNPCPCGNATDPEKRCVCHPAQIARYRQKLSGPIMDRIDLHIEVPRLKFEKLSSNHLSEKSKSIRTRVVKARVIQKNRFKKSQRNFITNSEMDSKSLREFCTIGEQERQLLQTAVRQMNLSPRGYHRLLKVARTIADLAESEKITVTHLAEAIQYRFRDEV